MMSEDMMARALAIIRPLTDEINSACAGQGERLREGLRVAIAGPPNARQVDIVQPAGAPRGRDRVAISGHHPDVLEVHLDLGGYPVTVLDTAGDSRERDPWNAKACAARASRRRVADLVLWVVDATSPQATLPFECAAEVQAGTACWLVANKIDLHCRR